MAQNLLYLDPWSGLSGDMMLAALLDAGGEALESVLHEAVASLGLKDVSVEITREHRMGDSLHPGERACRAVAAPAPSGRHARGDRRGGRLGRRQSPGARRRSSGWRRWRPASTAAPVDEIHFHEVGAADTLVDIVGTFVLVEALGVDKVFVGTIPVGGGTVEIAHGRMGVPAPATAALLAGYQVVGGPEMRELTTPTGALLAGQLRRATGSAAAR